MRQFDDNEYFLFKALSQNVIDGVSPAFEKITKVCELAVEEISEIEKKLENAETGQDINKYSKLSEEKRTDLIRLLAIKNRIGLLISRNKSRIAYINEILKNSGIYNEAFDKKMISDVEKQESENISNDALGLNVFDGINENEYKFFNGEILSLKNGILDFSDPHNSEILRLANEDFLSEIIKVFPSSMSTVPTDILIDTNVKRRVLKTIATYVIDETKKRDIKDVNKSLGSLLEFKTQITGSAEDYMAGVSNMFNVQIKQYLIEQNIANAAELKGKLKCNEKSELIPESKRVAVLAAGISGNIAPENEESEDMRIEREKEMQTNMQAVEFFEQLSAEVDEQAEVKNNEAEETKKLKEEQEKIIKKQKELEKEVKLEESEEYQLMRAMSNNKYDD